MPAECLTSMSWRLRSPVRGSHTRTVLSKWPVTSMSLARGVVRTKADEFFSNGSHLGPTARHRAVDVHSAECNAYPRRGSQALRQWSDDVEN